jgi:RND family efflux transporter MFP subunit
MKIKHKLLLLPLLLAACGKEVPPPEPIRPVKVMVVGEKAGAAGLSLPGEVRARYESPLGFRVGGKIVSCQAELGQSVKRGTVLAQVEATDYQLAERSGAANEAEVRSSMVLADAELARYRELHAKGFVSAAVLDQKQAAADAAHARLQALSSSHAVQARQLGYTTLQADGDGVLTAADCNPGQMVSAGQPVFRLAQGTQREIELHVPERIVAALGKQAAFDIVLDTVPGKHYAGKLRELAAAADPVLRTYRVRVVVAAPDSALQLGMSATVGVATGEGHWMRLPLSALTGRDGQPKVWRVGKDNVVHGVAVQIGEIEGNEVRIQSGLAAGEQVIVAGASLLRDGQQVRPMP